MLTGMHKGWQWWINTKSLKEISFLWIEKSWGRKNGATLSVNRGSCVDAIGDDVILKEVSEACDRFWERRKRMIEFNETANRVKKVKRG